MRVNKLLIAITFLSCFHFSVGFSQSKVLKGFENNSDELFKSASIPEKWKVESAVILATKELHQYSREERKLLKYQFEGRWKIQMNDKKALETFSKFYFHSSETVKIKIIKKDGHIVDIDEDSRVEFTKSASKEKLPNYYEIEEGSENEYYKIAIPGLQPGDIIDYYKSKKLGISVPRSFRPKLPSVSKSLVTNFPVVKGKIEVLYDESFKPTIYSGNGAQKFSESKGKLVLNYGNSDAVKSEKWIRESRIFPFVKVGMIMTAKYGDPEESDFGSFSNGKSRKEIVKERALNIYKEAFTFKSVIYTSANTYLKKRKANKASDPLIYSRFSYDYLQYTILKDPYYFSQKNYSRKLDDEAFEEDGMSKQETFILTLIRLFKSKNIPFEIVAAVPQDFESLETVNSVHSLEWGLKITGSKPMFIFTPGPNVEFGYFPYELEGTEYYTIVPDFGSGTNLIGPKYFPVVSPEKNVFQENYKVSFYHGFDSLKTERHSVFSGYARNLFRKLFILDEDGPNDRRKDCSDFDGSNDLTHSGYYGKDYQRAMGDKFRRIHENRKKKKSRDDYLEYWLDEEFPGNRSISFEIEHNSYSSSKPLEFTEQFAVANCIQKAGTDYLLDIGKLIGSQIEIYDTELDRDYDVYLDFPKTIERKIEVTIPVGYKVNGLDLLNTKLENETASFISTASVEGQKLIVEVKKTYKSNFVKKENWPRLVEILDEAYNFTHSRILLEKI